LISAFTAAPSMPAYGSASATIPRIPIQNFWRRVPKPFRPNEPLPDPEL
jgi:hypothetical protein